MSMNPPFHFRGPFMARVWLLVALAIIGVQMLFVINLLSSPNDPAIIENPSNVDSHSVQLPVADKLQQTADEPAESENAIDTNVHPEKEYPKETLKVPALEERGGQQSDLLGSLGQLMGGNLNAGLPIGGSGDNSQIFNFLQQSVMEQFTGGDLAVSNSKLEGMEVRAGAQSKLSQLMPLLTMLPMLLGSSGKTGGGAVKWDKYMPLLERMEKFAQFCTRSFQRTVIDMKTKYPDKAKQPSFSSAVAMKGFFRIFAGEDQQEDFLEMADQAYDLLDALGLTDHVIDLMSGRLYDQMSTGIGSGTGGKFDLASILLPSKLKPVTTTAKIDPDAETEEDDEDGGKSAFVSNEHFESIMELYDAWFRDDEAGNQNIAKMELNGRSFLQTWYESMRRYGREKGKVHAQKFSSTEFDKFMESIEVPYSNILDFYYPIKNDGFCGSSKLELLIVVISKTQHLSLRNAIRQTWGGNLAVDMKLVFLLTDRDEDRDIVKIESDTFGDIVTVDVPQTYEYVTRKALVTLDWPSRFCSSAKYILKTTDSSYVNLALLRNELGPSLVGNIVENEKVERVPLKLNHLFYDEYPYDIYPPYLKDFGFIMDMAFAKNGVVVAKDFPLIRTDDFAITGILSAKLKVLPESFKKHPVTKLLDIPWEDSQKSGSIICKHKGSSVFSGKLAADQMHFIQRSLKTCT